MRITSHKRTFKKYQTKVHSVSSDAIARFNAWNVVEAHMNLSMDDRCVTVHLNRHELLNLKESINRALVGMEALINES
jgi:hypothetical protein